MTGYCRWAKACVSCFIYSDDVSVYRLIANVRGAVRFPERVGWVIRVGHLVDGCGVACQTVRSRRKLLP